MKRFLRNLAKFWMVVLFFWGSMALLRGFYLVSYDVEATLIEEAMLLGIGVVCIWGCVFVRREIRQEADSCQPQPTPRQLREI